MKEIKVFVRTLIGLLLLLQWAELLPQNAGSAAVQPMRIGILHIESLTGRRFRDGVREAVAAYDNQSLVTLKEFPYSNERRGFERITELITAENKGVDLIMGPTESGVFVRALEQRKELEVHKIPVISSQVTARESHRELGWFFRTNVNIHRRAETIYDFLNKYWIKSIAVLYSSSEFGRRAEEAFKNELNSTQEKVYLPLLYESPPIHLRSQIRLVLDNRPDAVGIFGEREDIKEICKTIEQMNDGTNPYSPWYFTAIDAREIASDVQDIFFVSVTAPELKGSSEQPMAEKTPMLVAAGESDVEELAPDDVKALAFDTMTLVLQQLDAIAANITGEARREAFRDRFEARLRKSKLENSKTGMEFKTYENISKPAVYRAKAGVIEPRDLTRTVGFFEKANSKLQRLKNQFWYWPWFNGLVIVVVVFWVSLMELKRWYVGSVLKFAFNPYFLIVPLLNIAISLSLYVYMSESGTIRYDSFVAALVLALTPIAAMRTTLFETPTGKAIGLAEHYDRLILWVYNKLTVTKFLQNQAFVNLVAYSNSVEGMKGTLLEIYENSPNIEHRVRLETRMEEAVQRAGSWLQRRRILARFLLEKLSWKDLERLGLVASGLFSMEEIEQRQLPTDPEVVIRRAARHSVKSSKRRETVDKEISRHLAELEPARQKDLEATLISDMKGIVGVQGQLRKKIRFLTVLHGYDEEYLRQCDLLPAKVKEVGAAQPPKAKVKKVKDVNMMDKQS